MAAPSVTTSTLAPAQSTFYDRNLLENARANLIHERWGQPRPLPKGEGTSIKFRRVNTLSAVTAPLSQGIPPTGEDFTVTDITATPLQYGSFVTFSDLVDLQNQDPVLTMISDEQGEQSGLSADTLCRDVLVAGTTVLYSNGTARTDVTALISEGDLDKAVRALKRQNVKKITKMITAGKGFNTEPIRGCYIAIIHPDLTHVIQGFSNFIPVEKYADRIKPLPEEIGAYRDIRFVESTQSKEWAAGGGTSAAVQNTGGTVDVFATLVIGSNAYGIVPLSGMSLQFYVQQLGSAGAADPLHQYGSAGWKMAKVTKILNENNMVRIESATAA